MLAPIYTRQFARDIKRVSKRGKNLEKFKTIARTLLEGKSLDAIHRDHKLTGDYAHHRDCHIESDWLLIYKKDKKHVIFERMGTHSDLFK